MKTQAQREANREGKKRWRYAHPEHRIARRKKMAEYRARHKERWAATLKAWKKRNPDKVRAHKRAYYRRRRDGQVGTYNCATKGCPYRVPVAHMICNACCKPQLPITMHDRAIGITDFYRNDGSLPPLHTIKSRAKKGVQWI